MTENNKDKISMHARTENSKDSSLNQPPKEHIPAVQPLIWSNIIIIAALHVVSIYLFITRYSEAKFWTWIFSTYLSIYQTINFSSNHQSVFHNLIFIEKNKLHFLNKWKQNALKSMQRYSAMKIGVYFSSAELSRRSHTTSSNFFFFNISMFTHF